MLTSFHIKNFRSCKDVKLEDMRPILGLVGRNGAGKTTILRAIEWAAATALSTNEYTNLISEVDLGNALSAPQAVVELRVDGHEYRYTVGREFRAEAGHGGRQIDRDCESLYIRTPDRGDWVSLLVRTDDVVSLTDREQTIELGPMAAAMPALASLLPEADPLRAHLHRLMRCLSGVHYYSAHGGGPDHHRADWTHPQDGL